MVEFPVTVISISPSSNAFVWVERISLRFSSTVPRSIQPLTLTVLFPGFRTTSYVVACPIIRSALWMFTVTFPYKSQRGPLRNTRGKADHCNREDRAVGQNCSCLEVCAVALLRNQIGRRNRDAAELVQAYEAKFRVDFVPPRIGITYQSVQHFSLGSKAPWAPQYDQL